MNLWAITTYFNPYRFQTRRRNYDEFITALKHQGVPCLTIECAFGDQDFELPERLDVIRVRSDSLLWQKERLLNLAASYLPGSCEGVAWLDCDIIFMNHFWAQDTLELLKKHAVVQVWEECLRLDRYGLKSKRPEDRSFSFAMVSAESPHEMLACERYDAHGHTGYGWAMRKSIFDKVGLYEAAVSGSADHFMAHAIYDHYGFCVENALKHDAAQLNHLREWGHKFYSLVGGSLGVTPGKILHLWHGDLKDRRYFLRMHEITELGFNPYTDIIAVPGEPLSWNPEMNKPGLKEYFATYFQNRNEDGIITKD